MSNNSYRLFLLKNDLGVMSNKRDVYYSQLLQIAQSAIEREGIVLDSESTWDDWLVASYAAFLYRKRSENIPMPRMLRYNLNNRLLSQKGSVNND